MNTFGQAFATNRSEDDILSHQPIKIQLGSHEYDVVPLSILKNKKWRSEVVKSVTELSSQTNVQMHSMSSFMGGFMAMFYEFPERVLALVLSYAPNIDKAEVEKNATDEEVVIAFSRIMVVAYPFFGLLGTMQALVTAAVPASTSQQ